MAVQKTVDCKLLDKQSNKVLASGQIKITQSHPEHETKSLHVYEGEMEFNEFLPDLDSKSVILELTPEISGTVFLHFTHKPGTSHLSFITKVFFEDPIWKKIDWFDSL